MLSLLFAILSISLFATTLYASIQYAAPGQAVVARTVALSDNGFTSLGKAFFAYVTSTGVAPAPANWDTQLTPHYTFMPRPPANTNWSYGTNGTGYWFCLSGTINKPQYDGLFQLNQTYSAQQYFLGTGCGAVANSAAPASFPALVYATYWVTAP
jgi:hypothetical protein